MSSDQNVEILGSLTIPLEDAAPLDRSISTQLFELDFLKKKTIKALVFLESDIVWKTGLTLNNHPFFSSTDMQYEF